MNSPLQNITLPDPVTVGALGQFSDHHRAIKKLSDWTTTFTRKMNETLTNMRTQLNSQVQGWGAALASAATITPTNPNHHVTGTAAVATINAPTGFSGPIFLVSDNGFAVTTGGNIARAAGPFAANQMVTLTYDPTTGMWFV